MTDRSPALSWLERPAAMTNDTNQTEAIGSSRKMAMAPNPDALSVPVNASAMRERADAVEHDARQSPARRQLLIGRGLHGLDERRQAADVGEPLQTFVWGSIQPRGQTAA